VVVVVLLLLLLLLRVLPLLLGVYCVLRWQASTGAVYWGCPKDLRDLGRDWWVTLPAYERLDDWVCPYAGDPRSTCKPRH